MSTRRAAARRPLALLWLLVALAATSASACQPGPAGAPGRAPTPATLPAARAAPPAAPTRPAAPTPVGRPPTPTPTPAPRLDPHFGIAEGFRDPELMAEIGAGWERVILSWADIQPNGP